MTQRFYKHQGSGEIFAYEQSDIDIINLIPSLEQDASNAQAALSALPVPPPAPEEGEDEHAAEREIYAQAVANLENANIALGSVGKVFFDIRENLETLVEMTPQEVEEHINPPPPNDPPYVPQQVTRAQGKAALIQTGLWQSVLDYWASISDPVEKELAGVALNDTTHWQRTSPFLNAAAQALGMTSEQLDALFQQAAEIQL